MSIASLPVLLSICISRPLGTHAWSCQHYTDTGLAGQPWDTDCCGLRSYDCCARCYTRQQTTGQCAGAVWSPDHDGSCSYYLDASNQSRQAGSTTVVVSDGPSPPPTPPPSPPTSTEWTVVVGNATQDPQVLLSVEGSVPAPFQLRGFDYSPVGKCCKNNDASAFQKALYTRDIPRMAAMGANAIKLYGTCDGVVDGANFCFDPEPGCNRTAVTQQDVKDFLDFCLDHRIFVLLANRAEDGDVKAYKHIAKAYGAHPAVAGAILFDEDLDLPRFNAASEALYQGFCQALGKDPSSTPVEQLGRIITTAMQTELFSKGFQKEYGQYVNAWGWDPYEIVDYTTLQQPGVPFKPYMITENGIDGAGNKGCRNDCQSSVSCTSCSDFTSDWQDYVKWMTTARIGGLFVFEWTDENWKGGGDPCKQTPTFRDGIFNEANHGIFVVSDDGSLVAKTLSGGVTFESVLQDTWMLSAPGTGGFRGWQPQARQHGATLV